MIIQPTSDVVVTSDYMYIERFLLEPTRNFQGKDWNITFTIIR